MDLQTNRISLRKAAATDEEFLRTLFIDVRRDEFEAAGIPAEQLTPLLAMQYAAQKSSYDRAYPKSVHRIIVLNGADVGRMLTATDADRTHLIDISILRNARGRGIGTHLLEQMLAESDRVSLNVFRNNAGAIRLYERLGFRVISDDGVYYGMERNNA